MNLTTTRMKELRSLIAPFCGPDECCPIALRLEAHRFGEVLERFSRLLSNKRR